MPPMPLLLSAGEASGDMYAARLAIARKQRPKGIRNVYYICPQFWAWRPWRVNLVRRRFAEALCIFHFEEKFYADAGVPVKFIGHPLVGNVKATLTRELFCRKYGLEQGNPIITLLPGSRWGEIAHHVPVLVQALAELGRTLPDSFGVVVAVAPGLDSQELKRLFPGQRQVKFIEDDTYNALAAGNLAIVSSGTATVGTALLGTPMIVVYRLSPLTARLAKPLVRTRFFSMVNLIAGRVVVPELIQDDFTPQRVAAEAEKLLSPSEEGKKREEEMRRGLEEVR